MISANLSDISAVKFDLSKWQIQTTVQDIIFQMQQVTEEFSYEEIAEVNDNLVSAVEELKNVLIGIIKIFEYVNDYGKQKNFANYVADISYANDIKITRQNLQNDIDYLDIVIKSNFILQLYKFGMNVFKQFVFPFARIYLKNLEVPLNLNIKNFAGLENLVLEASNRIEPLTSKLDDHEESIRTNQVTMGISKRLKRMLYNHSLYGKMKNTKV